jgi:four helix bundle protein
MAFAFEELQVYKKSLDFAANVVKTAEEISSSRKHYRIIEQLEAASTSIALNIAEGKGRNSKKEFKQFLYISRGSLYETLALIALFKKLGWLPVEVCQKLYAQAEEISKMLSGLIGSLTEEN